MPSIQRAAFVLLFALAAHAASAQTPADTLEFSEVAPTLIGGIEAFQSSIVYPDMERRAGIQGRVILRFVVSPDGVPVSIQVARSLTPNLDSASIVALRASRFQPGTQGGQPAFVRQALPVSFRITGTEPAAQRTALDAGALLDRLGQTWSGAHLAEPDTIEAAGGGQRMVWRAPDSETERITADVQRDTLRIITVTARPGAPALVSVQRLAAAIEAERVKQDDAGYYTAHELGINGVPSRADLAVDLAARTWSFRAPPCVADGAGGCQVSAPILIGGIRAFSRRLRFPPIALRYGTDGTVFVHFEVGADGTVRNARPEGTPATGPGEVSIRTAAVRAVEASRWIPAGTANGRPIAFQMTMPVRFQVLDDWRDASPGSDTF